MAQKVKIERRFVKSEKMFFRISAELKQQMIEASERQGKSVSEYIRDLVKENIKSSVR